jgi:DNA-binding transcriptional ArsR family regulator
MPTRLDPVFESVAQRFGVLAEPARLRILYAVCQAERCVSEIIEITGLAQANVSRHLARLHQAGMLERRRVGTQVYYRVVPSWPLDLCRFFAQQAMGLSEPPTLSVANAGPSASVFSVQSKEDCSV